MPAARKQSSKNPKHELFFDQDRETKGTFRFKEAAEDGQRAVMGTIWIRKDIAEKLGVSTAGSAVKVTLEADSE